MSKTHTEFITDIPPCGALIVEIESPLMLDTIRFVQKEDGRVWDISEKMYTDPNLQDEYPSLYAFIERFNEIAELQDGKIPRFRIRPLPDTKLWIYVQAESTCRDTSYECDGDGFLRCNGSGTTTIMPDGD